MEAQATKEVQGKPDLDGLLAAYKAAEEEWITSIRAEEALALPDHSMGDWEVWDHAILREEEAAERAADARQAYEDALREQLLLAALRWKAGMIIADQTVTALATAAFPTFAVLIGIFINNQLLTDLERRMDQRFADVRESFRSDLFRVEQVMDGRLKHLEEHLQR